MIVGCFWDVFKKIWGCLGDVCLMIVGCFWDAFLMILKWFWDDFGMVLGSFWDGFWIILGSFWDHSGIILGWFWDHFGVRSSLGRQVTLEAELWGHTKLRNKNKQISWSIRQKMKRWSPKLERQHHFFWKSLKTDGFLMILRVREPRAGELCSPALENARTP